MTKRKSTVITPLHLLEELTSTLVEHFEQACRQALADAEKILSKLEKKMSKVQAKLSKQRGRIESTSSGKPKKQAKVRAKISVQEELLTELQIRTDETRQYIGELNHDIKISLTLAQGVEGVRDAACETLRQRSIPGLTAPESELDVNASSNVRRTVNPPRVAKKAEALKAIANAVVAKPVVTVTTFKPRKHAPSEIAPLAVGVAQTTVAPDPDGYPHTESALQAEWIESQP
jgi:hypothetical protein